MSNQEMQFADPDWKPSQQPGSKTNPQEQEEYTPQPINTDYGEQNKWKIAPPSQTQEEGYTGLRPYAGATPGQMQGGNFEQRAYRRRRGRGPWFWIILAFIIISLVSGGSRFGSSPNGPGFDHNPFNQSQIMGKPIYYQVSGQATIVINDSNGNVTVTEGKSNTDVIIQTVQDNSLFGNPNGIKPDIIKNGNTITANVQDGQQGSVGFNVTVPQNANLQLITNSGDISVIGVDGQMTLKTNSGNVDLTVPSTPSFHLNASTSSGSIHSNDFPGLNVQDNNSGSGQNVQGDVGGNSHGQGATVTITTDSGDINLNQR